MRARLLALADSERFHDAASHWAPARHGQLNAFTESANRCGIGKLHCVVYFQPKPSYNPLHGRRTSAFAPGTRGIPDTH